MNQTVTIQEGRNEGEGNNRRKIVDYFNVRRYNFQSRQIRANVQYTAVSAVTRNKTAIAIYDKVANSDQNVSPNSDQNVSPNSDQNVPPYAISGHLSNQGPESRRVSNGLTNIRRATKVFGRKLQGHVVFVGCFCS